MSALEKMMPPVKRADVNGVEIAYYEAGPRGGVPIVLCHGFPELAFSWRHQIKVSRCAARSAIPPHLRYADYGFRLAADSPELGKESR